MEASISRQERRALERKAQKAARVPTESTSGLAQAINVAKSLVPSDTGSFSSRALRRMMSSSRGQELMKQWLSQMNTE